MLKWIFGRKLEDALNETTKVRVKGVRFTIRKINVMNYLDGSNILRQQFDVKKVDLSNQEREASLKKQKEYLSQVLISAVVSPKIVWNDDGSGIFIDRLLDNTEIVDELHTKIMEYSYGKKKFRQSLSLVRELQKSTS